jgi:two-component system nitrate/nitrite response regulator NarL
VTQGGSVVESRGEGSMAVEQTPVGVVLVEPLRLVRAGLVCLLSNERSVRLVGDAGTADEAMRAIGTLRRKTGVVVLVSLGLPGEHDSAWLIRRIRDGYPTLRILGFHDNGAWSSISRALLEGADGYVDKNADVRPFVEGIRRCAEGEVVLEGLPRDWLLRTGEGNGNPVTLADLNGGGRNGEAPITSRERDVLELAAEGLTARQIATRLGLRERTVTTHLEHIYRKLGVSSRVAAVTKGAELGLVTVGTAQYGAVPS